METREASSIKTVTSASVAVVSHYRYETPRAAPDKPSLFSQVAVSCHELANCFHDGTAALRVADLCEFTQDHDDLTLLYAALI